MAKHTKRVVGLIGIASRMSNWNADFTGMPKSISDSTIFGSDKALKYSMKRLWEQQGKQVLYIRSYKIDGKEGKEGRRMQPRDLKERYQHVFEEEVSADSSTVLQRLFSCVDVMNFGATFAIEKQNLGLTGVVQIGQGFNKFPATKVEVQDILSPFRNSNAKSEDNDATSIGKKRTVDEAHYIYPFTVNPNHYDSYVKLPGMEGFEGYSEEAYEAFKEGALMGATALNTNSKSGSENAFSLFVVFKEQAQAYLPNLDPYVRVYNEPGESGNSTTTIYDLSGIEALLADVQQQIERVEVYVNPYTSKVRLETEGLQVYNIFNRKPL